MFIATRERHRDVLYFEFAQYSLRRWIGVAQTLACAKFHRENKILRVRQHNELTESSQRL